TARPKQMLHNCSSGSWGEQEQSVTVRGPTKQQHGETATEIKGRLVRQMTRTMVNPGGSSQPPPVGAGSLSWKRCAGCGGKIADRFLLYTMDSYWHSRCLKCSCCQAQLGEIGTSCYTKSGMILCRNDYIRLFGNSGACSACGQSIPASELVMRAQGNVYHLKCFTCSTCRNRLVPGDRFHYINGSLFCEHDRPTALINGHLSSLQTNPLLPDQKNRQVTSLTRSFFDPPSASHFN
ncbi:hypothetical protein KUCAC02_022640, partial [Chaenocephalus aceratus]